VVREKDAAPGWGCWWPAKGGKIVKKTPMTPRIAIRLLCWWGEGGGEGKALRPILVLGEPCTFPAESYYSYVSSASFYPECLGISEHYSPTAITTTITTITPPPSPHVCPIGKSGRRGVGGGYDISYWSVQLTDVKRQVYFHSPMGGSSLMKTN